MEEVWGQTSSTLEEQGQRSQWQRPVSCRIPSLSRVQALAALSGGGQLMPSLAGWPSRAIRGEEAHTGARFLACRSFLWEALAGPPSLGAGWGFGTPAAEPLLPVPS